MKHALRRKAVRSAKFVLTEPHRGSHHTNHTTLNLPTIMKRTSFLCCLAALLFLVLPEAIAQRQVVRGIVLSASDKQPVIGAAIVESGTSNGTSTGVDGRFAIETAPGAEIEVTFLGYVPQTCTLK